MERNKCKACGAAWVDHCGVEITCWRLQQCISAMKAMCVWAICEDRCDSDIPSLVPKHVVDLIHKTFDDIGVDHG